MPNLDERLRDELRHAVRPADPVALYEGISRRHARRRVARKMGTAALAVVVVLATAGGFLALSEAFRSGPGPADTTIVPTPTPSEESSPTEDPIPDEVGRDIGLNFRVCHADWLGGIDFTGDGTGGSAWIGVAEKDDGTCRELVQPNDYLLAVDHTGDRLADSWLDLPWACYVECVPFDATDLDGNGLEELVVASYFSIMDYYILTVRPDANGDLTVEPILTAEPGHKPAGITAGEPLRIDAGGDAGYGSQISCEGYPAAPVIVWSWSWHPVETERPKEIHVTRLQLQADGLFHVIGTNDYTVPASEPGLSYDTEPACGVDWHPAP